ncbi:MAG: hypothetical protein F4W90_12400 [Gammaproteobacteria bacterium]|nr:hypothetical protein [Gammaproteobacteria bacterium]
MSLSSAAFAERLAVALASDDDASAAALIECYSPYQGGRPDPQENAALLMLGKYGYSGRTSRYQRYVELLLAKGLRPELVSSAYLGLREHVSQALALDIDVLNRPNAQGEYPLHAAAERGDIQIVTLLIDAGADPMLRDANSKLPIDRALHAGPWKLTVASDVVALLAPLCGLESDLGLASASGRTDAVIKLLSSDPAKVDAFNEAGETPLFQACHNNRPEIVKLLLDAGADSNRPTRSGETPLASACLHRLSGECELAIIEDLIKAGATKTLESAILTQDLAFIRAYVAQKPEELEPSEEIDALYYAIHSKSPKSLELLVELGARPSATSWQHIERIFHAEPSFLARLQRLTSQF